MPSLCILFQIGSCSNHVFPEHTWFFHEGLSLHSKNLPQVQAKEKMNIEGL